VASIEVVTPILRRNLHDELAERLRAAIVAGEYKPGEKLPELELCRRFGVSRTPMREAMKVLATEGLVTLTPNRGAAVAKITQDELADLYPIMGALESLGGELAASRVTAAELAEIEAKHHAMVEFYKTGDHGGYMRLNEQIHFDIMHAARNQPLFASWQNLMLKVKRSRFVTQMGAERWRESISDHEEIVEALKARDSARLGAILRRHVRLKQDTVREAL
jgi:DNA-binding GntR family transcriptional regulator